MYEETSKSKKTWRLLAWIAIVLPIMIVCIIFMRPKSHAWTPETIPIETTYDTLAYFNGVCNPDTLLTPMEVAHLNRDIIAMRRIGVQVLVIAVKEIESPSDPHDWCMVVGNKYGVGGKKNLGVVMLIATKTHDWCIVTGESMEKYLTDIECDYIGSDVMLPLLRESRYGQALCKGVLYMRELCTQEINMGEEPKDYNEFLWTGSECQNTEDDEMGWEFIVAIFLILGPITWGILNRDNLTSSTKDSYGNGNSHGSTRSYKSSYGGGSFRGGGASGKW